MKKTILSLLMVLPCVHAGVDLAQGNTVLVPAEPSTGLEESPNKAIEEEDSPEGELIKLKLVFRDASAKLSMPPLNLAASLLRDQSRGFFEFHFAP